MAEIEVPVELVPVKTRILTDKDDIVDVIEEYAKHVVGPDDLVCTAESVVAITQHRYTRPEELTPSWQARLMRRFVPGEGSMASLYGMQAAMNSKGNGRCCSGSSSASLQNWPARTAFGMQNAVRRRLRMTLRAPCRLSINVSSTVRLNRIKWLKKSNSAWLLRCRRR